MLRVSLPNTDSLRDIWFVTEFWAQHINILPPKSKLVVSDSQTVSRGPLPFEEYGQKCFLRLGSGPWSLFYKKVCLPFHFLKWFLFSFSETGCIYKKKIALFKNSHRHGGLVTPAGHHACDSTQS